MKKQEARLSNTYADMTGHFDTLAAQCIHLSEQVSTQIEEAPGCGVSIQTLNDQPHNRWNPEFDIDRFPGCRESMGQTMSQLSGACFWSRRINLKDTWEDALLLCVPIVGSDGSVSACAV